MEGLSKEIAAGLDSVIEGLSYDIGLEYYVKDYENFPNFVGYQIAVTHKSGYKTRGELHDVEEHSIVVRSYTKGKEEPKDTRILYTKIREAKVWQSEDVLLTDDKMLTVIKGKVAAFTTAKNMLGDWVKSPNAPKKQKLNQYVDKLTKAGTQALDFFRKALAHKVDFESLDPTKHSAATQAKPVLLDAVFQLSRDLKSLEVQREEELYDFEEKEFEVGWPERYGTGQIFPAENYHKNWYNEEKDAVKICPRSTQGEIIEISGLKIQLPRVPRDRSKILFDNLDKKDQYWRRQKMPKNISKRNIDQYYDFIMEEYRRRREGIWFMNNGSPTYLTGNAYFALQHCRMFDTRGYMDFRIAQLHMFYHMEACIIDDRCFGQIFLKSRRTGFTYIALSILLNQGTSLANAKLGMTSKSQPDVEEVWEKFSYMFQSLPFWLRPVVKGKIDSNRSLYFGKPSDNSKESKKNENLGIDDYLQTEVDWRATTNGAYDSVKLDFYLGDEAGKWKAPNDYVTHLATVRPTMMPSGRVVGKAFIGSTMGAMKEGGEQFKQLIKGSFPKDRNSVTQKTPTALYYHFLPAQDNMEEYTDIYGRCWTNTPYKTVKNVLGKTIKEGSIDRLLAQEDQARKVGDKALNSQYRTYPRTMEHAMRDESNQCVFNMSKLYQQIEHNDNQAEEALYAVGNFEWRDVKDGDVVFNHNPHGRFKVSWFPSKADGTEILANRVKTVNAKHYPLNGDMIRFACDPFSLKSTHGKGSKGGLHGKTMMFAPGGVPNNKFIVEYLARPDDEYTFFEDVIKCIRYYSAPILVESNRIDLLRHMYNRGYRGFAMDRLDRPKDKLNPNEKKYGGQVMSSKDMLDSHQNAIGQWITEFVGVYEDEVRNVRPIGEMGDMPFTETLKDWLSFDPDNRTAYDATISSGLVIMACQTERYKGKKKERKKKVLANYVKKFDNRGQLGQPKKIIYGS